MIDLDFVYGNPPPFFFFGVQHSANESSGGREILKSRHIKHKYTLYFTYISTGITTIYRPTKIKKGYSNPPYLQIPHILSPRMYVHRYILLRPRRRKK